MKRAFETFARNRAAFNSMQKKLEQESMTHAKETCESF